MKVRVHFVSGADGVRAGFAAKCLIRKVIRAGLAAEKFPYNAEVTVTVTGDDEIREINRTQRNVDASTDILSFPMLDWHDGEGDTDPGCFDPQTGCVNLGDIILSMPHAAAQAKEYGHSLRRECGYLTIHSLLHLLGYDHVDDEPRRKLMRTHEEAVMESVGLPRKD